MEEGVLGRPASSRPARDPSSASNLEGRLQFSRGRGVDSDTLFESFAPRLPGSPEVTLAGLDKGTTGSSGKRASLYLPPPSTPRLSDLLSALTDRHPQLLLGSQIQTSDHSFLFFPLTHPNLHLQESFLVAWVPGIVIGCSRQWWPWMRLLRAGGAACPGLCDRGDGPRPPWGYPRGQLGQEETERRGEQVKPVRPLGHVWAACSHVRETSGLPTPKRQWPGIVAPD